MSSEAKIAWDAKYWIDRELDDPKRDWEKDTPNWVADYRGSTNHPHRKLILDEIKRLKPKSLLEIGCNAGPNLIRIKQEFPDVKLAGIDPSNYAIDEAKTAVEADLKIGLVQEIPFQEQFDVVLCDAVLMYVPDVEIYHVMNEIDRVAKKAVIIVDWHDESELGRVKDFHWARNYAKLMNDIGFEVETIKLTEETWPSKSWMKHGYVYVCRRLSQTSEKS